MKLTVRLPRSIFNPTTMLIQVGFLEFLTVAHTSDKAEEYFEFEFLERDRALIRTVLHRMFPGLSLQFITDVV